MYYSATRSWCLTSAWPQKPLSGKVKQFHILQPNAPSSLKAALLYLLNIIAFVYNQAPQQSGKDAVMKWDCRTLMFFLHSKLPGGAVILSALTSPGIIILIACQVCKLLLLTWQSKKDTSQIFTYMVWSCRPGIFNKKIVIWKWCWGGLFFFCIWLKDLFKKNEQDPIKYLTFSFLP